MTAENDLLHAIARQIRRGDRKGFERAGRVISQSMNDRRRTPWFRSKVEELAEIWLHGFEACVDELDPITCRQLPAVLRAVNPDWRRRPWGPSLSHVGRKLARAPMTDEEVAAFLDQLSTEDGFREWCVYGRQPCQNGLPVEPLIVVGSKPIHGAPVAQIYREGRIDRWWHPGDMHPDLAMLADTLIVFANCHGAVHEVVWTVLAGRLLPYMRSMGMEQAVKAAQGVVMELAWVSVFIQSEDGDWRCTKSTGVRAAHAVLDSWYG